MLVYVLCNSSVNYKFTRYFLALQNNLNVIKSQSFPVNSLSAIIQSSAQFRQKSADVVFSVVNEDGQSYAILVNSGNGRAASSYCVVCIDGRPIISSISILNYCACS